MLSQAPQQGNWGTQKGKSQVRPPGVGAFCLPFSVSYLKQRTPRGTSRAEGSATQRPWRPVRLLGQSAGYYVLLITALYHIQDLKIKKLLVKPKQSPWGSGFFLSRNHGFCQASVGVTNASRDSRVWSERLLRQHLHSQYFPFSPAIAPLSALCVSLPLGSSVSLSVPQSPSVTMSLSPLMRLFFCPLSIA